MIFCLFLNFLQESKFCRHLKYAPDDYLFLKMLVPASVSYSETSTASDKLHCRHIVVAPGGEDGGRNAAVWPRAAIV